MSNLILLILGLVFVAGLAYFILIDEEEDYYDHDPEGYGHEEHYGDRD
jgi:hypothetical protein